jgi:hypothetical protein
LSQLEILGFSSLKESFFVFLAFGFALGLVAVILTAAGHDIKGVESIVLEALALSVFSILSIFGLAGTYVSSWARIPPRFSQILRFISLPSLRVGLTTGFIASGVTIGLGAAVFAVATVFGFSDLANSGRMVLVIGVFILFVVWPFFFISAEMHNAKATWLTASAIIYIITVLYVLYSYERTAFWQSFSISVVYLAFGAYLRVKRKNNNVT